MQIKQIDVLVHPDFYQMMVPELSLHRRQLDLRERWEARIDQLKDREDTVLFYFSNIPFTALKEGLRDISTASNIIRYDDIERIIRFSSKLRHKPILYCLFTVLNVAELKNVFEDRGLTYNPSETKILAYGEVFGYCVKSYGDHVAELLGIPYSNLEYSRDMSLTKEDRAEIEWDRWNKFVGWI